VRILGLEFRHALTEFPWLKDLRPSRKQPASTVIFHGRQRLIPLCPSEI